MYGDVKLAESGLDSEVEAADPSACSHRIIHVAPFYKYPDGKDGTLVEDQGFEQPEELETHLSDSLTDKISLLVDTSEGGDPQVDSHTHDPQADDHTDEVCPSPPPPTSADSPLLPPLTHAGRYIHKCMHSGMYSVSDIICTYIALLVCRGSHALCLPCTHTPGNTIHGPQMLVV